MSSSDQTLAGFEAFYARHQDDLSRLAYLVMGEQSEAEDVTADAMVSAWQNWERVCRSDSPIAYVRRMVVNIAVSRVRGRIRDRRRFLALIPAVIEQTSGPDSAAVLDLRTALLALPPRRRACLVLRYAFDLSAEEVAETLQITVGTVKSQTSKAAAQLRQIIDQAGPVAAPLFTETVAVPDQLPFQVNRDGRR